MLVVFRHEVTNKDLGLDSRVEYLKLYSPEKSWLILKRKSRI